MLRVWHNLRSFGELRDEPATFPAHFVAVAEVNSVFPHDAFELTNHIDRTWWENEGVKKLTPMAVRSTSTGDVIEDMDGGALLLVKGFGFAPIEHGAAITWRDSR